MSGLITLTTDFGLACGYVGVMKGVILNINPRVNIVDITHQVAPQDVRGAAFILSTVYRFFPANTIHVVVVDPGVGTPRKALLIKTPYGIFIGPDNGVLSYVLCDDLRKSPVIDSKIDVFVLTESRYWLHPVSRTFHGRDIFAPVAGYLSLGEPIQRFGEQVNSLFTLPPLYFFHKSDGTLEGEIAFIDAFGNLITSVMEEDVAGRDVLVRIKGVEIKGLKHSYQETESQLLALIGSNGYLEIAMKNGSASNYLKAVIGDRVEVMLS